MTKLVVFDGRAEAKEIEERLRQKVAQMAEKPKLAIVLMGDDIASQAYVRMKKRVAERVGIRVEVFEKLAEVDQEKFDGVMVQLPSEEDLTLIRPKKDVDGLNPASGFVPATVKAVEKILVMANEHQWPMSTNNHKLKMAIVGAKGMVGRALVRNFQFSIFNFKEIGEFDLGDDLSQLARYDVVISCTGQEGLIKPEMVKTGVVCIDVGFPKGDFDSGVKGKAAFWMPVPGGVGPMTVVCLLENLVKAVDSHLQGSTL